MHVLPAVTFWGTFLTFFHAANHRPYGILLTIVSSHNPPFPARFRNASSHREIHYSFLESLPEGLFSEMTNLEHL